MREHCEELCANHLHGTARTCWCCAEDRIHHLEMDNAKLRELARRLAEDTVNAEARATDFAAERETWAGAVQSMAAQNAKLGQKLQDAEVENARAKRINSAIVAAHTKAWAALADTPENHAVVYGAYHGDGILDPETRILAALRARAGIDEEVGK